MFDGPFGIGQWVWRTDGKTCSIGVLVGIKPVTFYCSIDYIEYYRVLTTGIAH